MFELIQLSNFKGIKKAEIKANSINLLIGPNGSGKSSIFHALMFLKQSKNSPTPVVSGNIIDLGVLDDLIKSGSDRFSISLSGKIDLKFQNYSIQQLINIDEKYIFDYVYHIVVLKNGSKSIDMEIRPSKHSKIKQFIIRGSVGYDNDYDLDDVNIDNYLYHLIQNDQMCNIFSVPIMGNKDQISYGYLLSDVSKAVVEQLNMVYYVPAYRGFTKPSYPLEDHAFDDFTSHSPEQQSREVSTTFGMKRELEDKISSWIDYVTNVKITHKLFSGPRTGVRIIKNNLDLSIIHEGFGTNQLVQLFLTLAAAKTGSTILIEEPEIHLHPKAQSKIAELLTKIALQENKQIFITTHSEHILFRILSMIKNNEINKDKVSIYHFNENTNKPPELLEINEHGQIEGGLKSFFEAEIEEIGQYFKVKKR